MNHDKLHKAPFANPEFKVSIITDAPDLETATGISEERADEMANQIMNLLNDPHDPTTAELMLAGVKVSRTMEELIWAMFKVGTYAEIKTGQGKKILDDYDRNNPSTNVN